MIAPLAGRITWLQYSLHHFSAPAGSSPEAGTLPRTAALLPGGEEEFAFGGEGGPWGWCGESAAEGPEGAGGELLGPPGGGGGGGSGGGGGGGGGGSAPRFNTRASWLAGRPVWGDALVSLSRMTPTQVRGWGGRGWALSADMGGARRARGKTTEAAHPRITHTYIWAKLLQPA
jgi:hypothetical protein